MGFLLVCVCAAEATIIPGIRDYESPDSQNYGINNAMHKMIHERFICPVGHGGFSVEIIEDYVVVYDCGSTSSPQMVESCIDKLALHVNHVDLLFISHFDKDHVNTLRYLLSSVRVKQAVTSLIPKELRWCYNVYTKGAYMAIMNLLGEYNVESGEYRGNEVEEERFHYGDIWEWISKSMMTQKAFTSVKAKLPPAGIDIKQIENPNYVEREKEAINNVFKDVFGGKGPNAKGLIMLSQHCEGVDTLGCYIAKGCIRCHSLYSISDSDESSCLYVGDADLANRASNKAAQKFLKTYRTESMLQLMQIPHHGSRYNVGVHFEQDYRALYYFLKDRTTERLQKNKRLFQSLMSQKKLLVARDVCKDMIYTDTRIK